MGIEHIKRWQWILIALLLGVALGYMNSSVEPGTGLRSMSGPEFEREINLKEVQGTLPNLRNIVVHPAQDGAYERPVNVVTLERAVMNVKEQGWRYQPYALQAEVPFVSRDPRGNVIGGTDGGRTVLTALETLKAKNPAIQFRYAWWEEPRWVYTLWVGGAVVVIGGIWPTIISLMVGAGLGRKPEPEKEYDLERFSHHEEEKKEEPVKKEMSEEEKKQLAAQLEKLEKNVGASTVMTDVPAPVAGAAGTPAAGPIRELSNKPLELLAAQQAEDEEKEYKGEFYPVARQVHHKENEPVAHKDQ